MKKVISILESLLIIVLLFITILLSIKFIVKIKHEQIDSTYLWNITFSNPKIKEGSQDGEIKTNDNELNFSVTLKNEEEFYEYTIDIKNEGNLDAQISEINQEIKSTKNILVAQINYDDGTEIKKGDVLKSGDKKTVKVSITYPKQKEKIYDELTLELSFSLKYVPVS